MLYLLPLNCHLLLPWSLFLPGLSLSVSFHLFHYSLDIIFFINILKFCCLCTLKSFYQQVTILLPLYPQIVIFYCPAPCFFNCLHLCPFIFSIIHWILYFYQHFQIMLSLYPQIFLSTVPNYATISNYNFLLPCSLFLQLSSSFVFHLCHCSMDTIFLSTFSNSDVSVPSNLFINSYQLCYHLKLQFFYCPGPCF